MDFGPEPVAIFQCDECLQTTTMMGEPIEVAFTFAVRPDGSWFDPKEDDDEGGGVP
jgi:hypothetical protein